MARSCVIIEPPCTKDKVKKIIPAYIPTIIIGAMTITSIITSTILSRKTEASIAAMALLADQGWRKYKGVIKNKLGGHQHIDAVKDIGKKEYAKIKKIRSIDGKELYFEEHIGFFRANPEKLALAYSDLNQRLIIEDYGSDFNFTTLNILLTSCDADILDQNLDKKNLRWGWSMESLCEIYGYVWVHMNQFETEENGKIFKTIVWGEDPILDPLGLGNDYHTYYDDTDIRNIEKSLKFKSALMNKETEAIENI